MSSRYAASSSKPYYSPAAAPQPPYVAPFGHAAPPPSQAEQPEREKFEVIPMNADKPSGIDMGDFLPDKFRFGFYFAFCLRKIKPGTQNSHGTSNWRRYPPLPLISPIACVYIFLFG